MMSLALLGGLDRAAKVLTACGLVLIGRNLQLPTVRKAQL